MSADESGVGDTIWEITGVRFPGEDGLNTKTFTDERQKKEDKKQR